MHTDTDSLALLALGEPVSSLDDPAHVSTCPVCAAELAGLRRVVDLARGAAGLALTEPGPRVWATIRQELDARTTEHELRVARETRAHARLTAVQPSWSEASGEAELETDEAGRRLLRVSLHADLPGGGVRQAWLVHRDDPRTRQTLGVLDGRHGLWTVEHAIDLEQFPILEISQQTIGSTEHSGQTIVRGELVRAA